MRQKRMRAGVSEAERVFLNDKEEQKVNLPSSAGSSVGKQRHTHD